ncbi:MAG TPA: hypothetical protein VNS08_11095, partial [Ureibacillus sp.]|nr:hypothetical protein [Ureibacillus sp.]
NLLFPQEAWGSSLNLLRSAAKGVAVSCTRPSIPINFQSISFLILRFGYFFEFFTYGSASLLCKW